MCSKILKFIIPSLIIILCIFLLPRCGMGNGNPSNDDKKESLNITILLDLSDRLVRGMVPTQFERDTAIVDYVVDYFISQCQDEGIIECDNSMRVIFYPEPPIGSIAKLASDLDLDLTKLNINDKKKRLKSMKENWSSALTDIYNATLNSHNWVGCDIWGFFSNKNVDKYCMKDNSRNILIILTDGYLFHINNKIKEGNNFSFVLPQTLSDQNSKLIVRRNGLDKLEVLVLEVNPYDPKTYNKMSQVLTEWFNEMGVKKVDIVETAMPKSTEKVIDKFLRD